MKSKRAVIPEACAGFSADLSTVRLYYYRHRIVWIDRGHGELDIYLHSRSVATNARFSRVRNAMVEEKKYHSVDDILPKLYVLDHSPL
jgi:hypothetical protein